MFEKHIAAPKDFIAIEKGLKAVWSKELSFIFKKKDLIEKVVIISFDSQNLYLWSTRKIPKIIELKCNFKKYKLFKKPHKLKTTNKMQKGWMAGIDWKFFNLPERFNWYKTPTISGSLMTPFVGIHKNQEKQRKQFDPYKSYESYLATIVHEFGHAYYNLHKLCWFSDKKENISYLKTVQSLYSGKKTELKGFKIKIPMPTFLTEVFAFCCDYYAASVFWPNHLKDINTANIQSIKKFISYEKSKNLDIQDSVLGLKTPHDTAMIIGKLLLHLYPKTWPYKLLKKFMF